MPRIEIPEDYSVSTPTQNLLMIRRNTKYVLIDLKNLEIVENTLGKKLLIEIILKELSWIPPTPVNRLIWNKEVETKKQKKTRRTSTRLPEQSISMLNFVKPKK